MEEKKSLNPEYFKDVYAANEDPWNFETSEYEAAKYSVTIALLPGEKYENALEIGCSIGVLTQMLAEKCIRLLATDVSEKALDVAAKRCAELDNVSFQLLSFPKELPKGQYDLIMISEVAYYLSYNDWEYAMKILLERILTGGHIVLVHWLPEVHDYPQTGDEVHNSFKRFMKNKMINISSERRENYRIDVWEKL